jgi:hypothetical protein
MGAIRSWRWMKSDVTVADMHSDRQKIHTLGTARDF